MHTILIVEDEARIAKVVEKNLGAAGFDCRVLGNGREALDALATFTPNVIVLDVMLPGLDGLEVVRRVRETSRVPRIDVRLPALDPSP